MPRVKGKGVTWATIQKEPVYRAIWELLQSGPKTFPQIRQALKERTERQTEPLKYKVLPGTLIRRLYKLREAGLVEFETRPEVLHRWQEAKIFHPDDPSKRGPPSTGAWWLDTSASIPLRVALDHADLLTKTPKENLTVERIGNGTDLLVAGSTGDNARWWYPAQFNGSLGVLFELMDRSARELGRSILAGDRDAVAAQETLREVVKRYRPDADKAGIPLMSVPEIRAAVEHANQFRFLVTVAVYPAHWWEDSGIPIELASRADLTIARIHERTRPSSCPIHAVSPEEGKRWAQTDDFPTEATTIIAATVRPKPTRRRQRQNLLRRSSSMS